MNFAELHAAARAMSVADWCEAWFAQARGEATLLDLPALPPDDVQTRTNNMKGLPTMQAAAQFYRIAVEEIDSRFGARDDLAFLDYGAGWGRITRFFLRTFAPDAITAVEVDAILLAAMRSHLPGIRAAEVAAFTPFPFPDGSFDVVIANSVFSHLSERAHRWTVAELARVMRPGGLFLGTTLGRSHLQRMGENQTDWLTKIIGQPAGGLARIDAGEFVYGDTHRWPDYGLAFVPNDWPRDNWRPLFEVGAVRTDYGQDVQVAVRSDAAAAHA